MISLGNFTVILKFALDLEAMAAAFYETANTITQTQELKSLFEALLLHGQRRINLLMQTRREATLEKANQPIPGLESQKYRPHTECPPGCPDAQLLQLASNMERQIQQFYLDAAEKISFLTETANLFEELAKEHQSTQKQLQTAS